MPQNVRSIAKEIGAYEYAICGNGTLIYDFKNEESIYSSYLDKEKVLQIIKICEENSIYYNVYTESEVITKSLNYNTLFYDSENNKKPLEKRTRINVIENIYNYIEENENLPILKMTICDSDKIIFSSIVNKLKTISKIEVLDVEHMSRKLVKYGTTEIPLEYYYTEITKKNTNKWIAIEFLIKYLGIKESEVIAIGDNINDKEMVENAGVGIAMGNSMLSCNKIGDVVVSDNDHNGVAEAIKRYVGRA